MTCRPSAAGKKMLSWTYCPHLHIKKVRDKSSIFFFVLCPHLMIRKDCSFDRNILQIYIWGRGCCRCVYLCFLLLLPSIS